MYDRFELLVGTDAFMRISNLTIMVVGVGGVGGYVVEALARCGVKKLILVDYDKVEITNFNRQMIASKKNLGKYKVDAFKERILDISTTEVEVVPNHFSKDLLDKYFPDYLIDCVDDISAKCEMIKLCLDKKIPFISSLGTGKRLDPSKLEITTLDKTSYDPLARILRKFVRDENMKGKIPVLFSREEPLSIPSREIASCSFVPSSAGLLIASWVIREELKK